MNMDWYMGFYVGYIFLKFEKDNKKILDSKIKQLSNNWKKYKQ